MNRAKERKRQVIIFQLPEETQAIGGREYILTIPETQTVSIVQPTQTSTGEPVTVIGKVQPQQAPRPSSLSPSTQPTTSCKVLDDQQPGTSRQMIYNPPSVGASQQEESQNNTSLYSISRMNTTAISALSTSKSTITSEIFHSSRTVKTSQQLQPAESESAEINGFNPKYKIVS